MAASRPSRICSLCGGSSAGCARQPRGTPGPKQALLALVRQSPQRGLRADVLPFGTARVGPGYNARLGAFVQHHWNPAAARQQARSLDRAMAALDRFSWP